MKTPARKIGPLSVWIVGHPDNPLIHGNEVTSDGVTLPLAVFYKRKDAQAFKRAHKGTFYRVMKATILREPLQDAYKVEAVNVAAENHKLKQELDALKQSLHDGKTWNVSTPRITPRAQSALNLAEKEAQKAGATYVGTEHVLLGLLKQGEGVAQRHFLACGMTYEKAEYAMRVGRVS